MDADCESESSEDKRMALKTEVLILSAFGRGHSLAMALAAKEIPVTLLDISSQLGRSSPEEWEGPFGLNLSGLTGIQKERMNEDDPIIPQGNGFTLLVPSGPIELKGPVTEFRLKALGFSQETIDLLRIQRISDSEVSMLTQQGFDKNWILAALKSFPSSRLMRGLTNLKLDQFYLPNADFAVRDVSRAGVNRSIEAASRRLVVTRPSGALRGLSDLKRGASRKLEFSEGQLETSEVLEYQMLVCCLTSEEVHFVSPKIAEKLFPAGAVKPLWYWNKFRFKLAANPEREALPHHSLWLRHPDLPWVHDNFVVVQRTASPELVDVWCRLPYSMRFQRSYLHEIGDKIIERFALQSPGFVAELNEEPSTVTQSFEESGPTRFPVFGPEQILPSPPANNVLFHSPESWPALGWSGLFDYENNLIPQIEAWWVKTLQERMKSAQRAKVETK